MNRKELAYNRIVEIVNEVDCGEISDERGIKKIMKTITKVNQCKSKLNDDSQKFTSNNRKVQSNPSDASSTLDAPCVVCQKKEEVDSGMCENCFQEAQDWANEELKFQNRTKEVKGCGKKVGNWKCGTIFNDEVSGKKVFLCFECEKLNKSELGGEK